MYKEIAYAVILTECKTQIASQNQFNKITCFHCKYNIQENMKTKFASLLAKN